MPRKSDSPQKLQDGLLKLIWEGSYSSVTIDAICGAAGVQKGSFYHFYHSKAELTLAAFEGLWERVSKPNNDAIFSASKKPSQRLVDWLDFLHQKTQNELRSNGRALGCPLFNIGQETSGIEPEITAKIDELLQRTTRYLAETLREAQLEDSVEIENAEHTARALVTLALGSMSRARISNSLQPLEELAETVHLLLQLKIAPATSKAA